MWFLFFIPLFIYVCLVIWFVKGWASLSSIPRHESAVRTTILIPCRNESENISKILESIAHQNFDFSILEVIVIDDHSQDDTYQTALEFKSDKFKPFFIKLKEDERGKKVAINAGISSSQGEIIVCTDADCLFGNLWLSTITAPFNAPEVQLVSGPVMFQERKGIWNELMQLEFISLIAIGAASIQNRHPNMCNGANIAYRKSAFYEVGGFKDNAHLPSGDDEFLMHKINKRFAGSVRFIKNSEAMVFTEPPNSLSQFVNQRIRWGSKTGYYKGLKAKLIPGFMFLFSLILFLTPLFYVLGMPWSIIATLWLVKLGVEVLFFSAVLPFFRSSKLLDMVIVAQVFHVTYIALIGIMSVAIPYHWKGRKN